MEEGSKEDLKERTLRSIKQGLGRLWRRRSVTITEYDPSYKVFYLGNVITGWAKGEGCVEKPLCTLWKNYQSTSKPEVQMKVTVTQSGLKAVTKEHGLTEYWSHRITYCAAPSAFPKVFCWVYRHEGRKLKQELRCHAVLCSKESIARRMAQELKSRLAQALTEFKRDKLSKQNARLSLANSVYDNPSLPRRKILLSTGSQNYRPPLERSKSAPKLMSIEESLEEEEEPEIRKSFRTKERFRVLRYKSLEERRREEGFLIKKKEVCLPLVRQRIEDSIAMCEDGDEVKEWEGVVESNPRASCDCLTSDDKLIRGMRRLTWDGGEVEEEDDNLFDEFPSYRQLIVEEGAPDSLSSIDSGVSGGGSCLRRSSTGSSAAFQGRRKLLESLLEGGDLTASDLYHNGHQSLTGDSDYPEEESTPSLQSLSSGSDRDSSGRPALGLDSLSEEESDESGFADGGHPQPGSDDKARDLPHHQLVKSCALTTKSQCVQV